MTRHLGAKMDTERDRSCVIRIVKEKPYATLIKLLIDNNALVDRSMHMATSLYVTSYLAQCGEVHLHLFTARGSLPLIQARTCLAAIGNSQYINSTLPYHLHFSAR